MIADLSPGGVLKTLFWLRVFAILGQVLVLLVSKVWLELDLNYLEILSTSGFLLLWNITLFSRIKKNWVVTQAEIFLNIVIDTSALAIILFWAGGATNPFISLLLVPVAITAAAQPGRYVIATASLCILYYSVLMIFDSPTTAVTAGILSDFNLHLIGMWINFILSTTLMAAFIASIAGIVKQKQSSLYQAKENALINEKIVAMGTLATGVAHEINTPLSTITMLIDEIKAVPGQDKAINKDLDSIKQQAILCSERIKTLLVSSGHSCSIRVEKIPLKTYFDKLLNQWKTIRPEIILETEYAHPFHNPRIAIDQTISQSISNLLNNAADATIENGSKELKIALMCDINELHIWIDDRGQGISSEQIEHAGRVSYSTKDKGLGIGLILSNASVNKLNGRILYRNITQGGTRTEIHLPIKSLVTDEFHPKSIEEVSR